MRYQITVYSFANPLAEPIWCDNLEQVDEQLGKLPFEACRDVRDENGQLVDEYIPF